MSDSDVEANIEELMAKLGVKNKNKDEGGQPAQQEAPAHEEGDNPQSQWPKLNDMIEEAMLEGDQQSLSAAHEKTVPFCKQLKTACERNNNNAR